MSFQKTVLANWSYRSVQALSLLLVLACGLAGWKVAGRSASANLLSEASATNAQPARLQPSTTDFLRRSPGGRFDFQAQFVSAVPGRAVHAASMVELANQDVRAVWFSGSREGARDVTIQTAVMDHVTGQWQPERAMFERHQIERGLWRYVKKLGNPVIARAPDGSLVLWMVNVSLGGWAGSAITWARSSDEGATWSQPRRLVTSPFLNISTLVKGAPFAFADGQLGLPVYHEFISKFAEILRLDTDGRVVDKVRLPDSQASLQPVVLVSGPLNAQVFMRSDHAHAMMASSTADAGKTWLPTHPTIWPNPDSALAGVMTAGGGWLAINPTTDNRESLSLLAAGKDGNFDAATQWVVESSGLPMKRLAIGDYESLLGKQLMAAGVDEAQSKVYVASARRQLCGEQSCAQEFSYPHLLKTRDGTIHLLYTWHRIRIKHIRFDPQQTAMRLP